MPNAQEQPKAGTRKPEDVMKLLRLRRQEEEKGLRNVDSKTDTFLYHARRWAEGDMSQAVLDDLGKIRSQEERAALFEAGAKYVLSAQPQTDSIKEAVRQLKAIKFLQAHAPNIYEQVASWSRIIVDGALKKIEQSTNTTHESQFSTAQQLYELISGTVTPQDYQECQKALQNLEKKILATTPQALREFCTATLQEDRNANLELAGMMEEMAMFSPRQKIWQLNEQLRQFASHIEEQDGKYYYKHRTPDGREDRWLCGLHSEMAPVMSFRRIDNPEIMTMIEGREFMKMIETGKFDELLEQAVKDYQSERSQESKNRIEEFDLDKQGKFAHLRLLPRTYDAIISKSVHSSMIMESALKNRYGEKLVTKPILFSDSPKEELRRQIGELARSGIKNFYVDVFSHGQPGYFKFKNKLTARDLADLAREFPDCHFTYNTIACYGGGLRNGMLQEMKQDPSLEQRIDCFTQIRPHSPLVVPVRAKGVTNYYLRLIEHLTDKNIRTYGEAARKADLETKKELPVDAEAIISGHLITMNNPSVMNEEIA